MKADKTNSCYPPLLVIYLNINNLMIFSSLFFSIFLYSVNRIKNKGNHYLTIPIPRLNLIL